MFCRRTLRSAQPLGILALLAFTLAPRAEAQFAVLPYAGYNTHTENLMIGLGAEIGLPITAPAALALRPSGEYLMASNLTLQNREYSRQIIQLNVDLVAQLGAGGLRPFAGAGLAVTNTALDTSDNDALEGDLDSSTTSVGANLFAGASLSAFGPVRPFVQARLTLGDDNTFAALGGLRVGL